MIVATVDALLNENLGTVKLRNLLDVACGQGQFLQTLFQSFSRIESAIGVDPEPRALIAAAKQFDHEPVEFITGRGESLAFPDNHFNAVSISNALHHVDSVPKTLAEMYRVLQPGGWFIVNEMHRDDLTPKQTTHMLYHHFVAMTDRLRGVSHYDTWRRQALVDFFEALALRNCQVIEYREPFGDEDEREAIQMMHSRLSERMEQIEGEPDYRGLQTEAVAILKRLDEVGFAPATKLLILGQKSSP